ncbi:MAG: DUF2993 domain-containing protein [Elainella sp. Prado103]|jgi:hypothetical protein|nr:DUF2993 domain-containing protein [Elainella sp. Prado103]
MSQQPNLGEQAIDKVAELAISSQLEQTDQLDVVVKTDPLQLMQGKVETVTVAAEGMVVKPDLRATAVGIEANSIAIDPLKVMLGEIVLTESLSANAHVVLTERDINQALASDFLKAKMQNLQIQMQGRPTSLQIEQITLKLPDDQALWLEVRLKLVEQNEYKQFSAMVKPLLAEAGYCLNLEVIAVEGEGLTLDFVTVLLNQVEELLDLRNFNLGNISLRLKEISLQPGQILLRGGTVIEPGSLNLTDDLA